MQLHGASELVGSFRTVGFGCRRVLLGEGHQTHSEPKERSANGKPLMFGH